MRLSQDDPMGKAGSAALEADALLLRLIITTRVATGPVSLPTITFGCQTWSLNRQLTNKLRTAHRAMERKMLGLKLQNKIPCSEIRKRTQIIDIIEYALKQTWRWVSHNKE